MEPSPTFLSVTEAAEKLGISRAGILKQIYEGRLPARKIGRAYAISVSDLPDVLNTEISQADKKRVEKAVSRVVKEYGETLKKLAKE